MILNSKNQNVSEFQFSSAPYDILSDLGHYLRLLPPLDRRIMELILTGQMSIRKAALLLNKNPGVVCRKYARIRTRLNHPVAHALVNVGAELAPIPFRVATDHFIAGQEPPAIARKLDLPLDHVLKLIKNIHAWSNHYLRFRAPNQRLVHYSNL